MKCADLAANQRKVRKNLMRRIAIAIFENAAPGYFLSGGNKLQIVFLFFVFDRRDVIQDESCRIVLCWILNLAGPRRNEGYRDKPY